MEWTENAMLTFIKKIQSHPCLWNPADKNKKNRSKVRDAFKNIAEEMNTENIEELKKKKEIIFQTYRGYRRKVLVSQKSGAGTDDIYKPTWPPYSLLDEFLHGIYSPKGRFDTLITEDEGEQIVVDVDEDQASGGSFQTASQFSVGASVPSTTSHAPSNKKRKCSTQRIDAVHDLRNLQAGIDADDEDSFKAFGNSVAAQLRKLSGENALLAQRDIQNILTDYGIEDIRERKNIVYFSTCNRPSSPASTSS
ncbi:unnamed protein product [Phyllotreta striolata]|uniref:MADF domain-containing protein n=1 Tax=Phyllotreta striolata TaxID=444603 RepID=A0A9N9TV14_PHYSR|nr:unnamed protein product [Phyllotreta striolata]